jgi:excisionase family DNA binding protein
MSKDTGANIGDMKRDTFVSLIHGKIHHMVVGSQSKTREEEMVNGVQLLTVYEVAEALNLSPGTVRAWILNRKLATVHLGRAVRIPFSEVERLINEGTTHARFGTVRR